MYEWLFFLLTPAAPVMSNATPPEDYVGVVAAEVAYSTLLHSRVEPDKPTRPIDPNCKTCGGKGKVPSGDGQGWSNCPTCQAITEVTPAPKPAAPAPKTQGEAPKPLFKKAPVQSIPPQSNCPGGVCPPSAPPIQQNSAVPGFVPVVVPFGLRRLFRRRG